MSETKMKNVITLLICMAVLASAFIMPASADSVTPGTVATETTVFRTANAAPTVQAATSTTSLSPRVTETGKISLSVDGLGIEGEGTIQVEKPVGATVRSAYLMAADVWGGHEIADGEIKINDQEVNWDYFVYKNAHNYWADVTDLVKTEIDDAPAGRVDLTINEGTYTNSIDGTVLVIIFNDPNQVNDNTIVLLFGAQDPAGDTFNLLLADPIDKNIPDMSFDMGLGISYSYQYGGTRQYSIVTVNGETLTSAAGGEDDGYSENGGLITVGGLDDSNANPKDPSMIAQTDCRQDDELYNILPLVKDGVSTITVNTLNPSNDDNIFFAYFDLKSTVAIVGEGIVLSPASATKTVGTSHTVTATVQDDAGNPVESKEVTFLIESGVHSGQTTSAYTDSNGEATFTYSGVNLGTDTIVASFEDSHQETVASNEVTCIWTTANNEEIPEFPTIAIPMLGIIGLAFVFNRRNEE